MPEIVLASGGIVEALKAYDPGIRVRMSHEKKKWCVEAPHKRPDMMVPPVVFTTIPGTKTRVESLLPWLCDRAIAFRDRMQIILWTDILTWDVYKAVVQADTQKYRSRNELFERVENAEAQSAKEDRSDKETRVKEARKRFKWEVNRNPMSV